MKNNFKIKLIGLIIIIFIVMSTSNVSNAYSMGVTLNADKNLAPGDEISVTVSINKLDIGKGIDAFMATIQYDKKVFEALNNDSVVATNGWNKMFNPSTNIFTLLNNSKITRDSDIAIIKLRAKTNISDYYSTEVKLVNVSASGGAVMDGGTGDINLSKLEEPSVSINRTPYSSSSSNTKSNISSNTSSSKTPNEPSTPSVISGATSQNQPENANSNGNAEINQENKIYTENELANDMDNQELHLLNENNEIQLVNNDSKESYKKIIIPVVCIILVASFIIGYIRYKKIKKKS